ncbi:TonB-dependent receptor [Sphingomonas sp. UV9]|uniref:TonB-dependent receptor plug domain-containing protein n=1 Tax=Sphingomonas sp. UV9 TaxID=1851410 RepID=UPI000FFB8498|nr:TonB-dependent receptor plug domain-containing protein [Sphingomonas sp. UV9]RXD03294.1 TonB-dependent receptor [Sphingomonas sp. UV9]
MYSVTRDRRLTGILNGNATSLAVLAVALLCTPAPALAQTTPTADADLPAPVGTADQTLAPQASIQGDDRAASTNDIVVTGTRITSSGFNAPTPTTVIGEEQILKNAQPNIFTTVAQLPSLQGSTGANTGTFSTSSGSQGLSSFSLRGLGTIRTLTLLDGQRVVGANVTGVPDISQFPQLLIKRVDIVNGGASASYGSDAVGGVINFITDTKFTGFKANVQTGVTTYGDDGQVLFQAAVGKSFANDKLHVILSGEYAKEQGVGPGNFGEDLAGSRDWYRATTLVDTGIRNNGSPQFLYRDNGQAYQYTKYGLISAGPLQGTAFDANGQPFQFQYGSNGVPAKNAAGTVNGCFVGFCVGGDQSGHVGSGTSLQSAVQRLNGYTRIGYDIAPDTELYVTANVAQVKTSNQPNPGSAKTGLTIQCANPYLPASISAACAANGITTFQYGLSNAILPNIKVNTDRRQYRFVGGLKGKADLLGTNWSYDAYYEHGINITDIDVDNISLTGRYNQAINATRINGQIVCANAAARAAGCQPINIFGGATPSPGALAYVTPAAGPFQHTKQTQDAAAGSISGEPITLWAGPLAVAAGVEWRREFYRVNADPYGAGVSDISPNSALYPTDPNLNSTVGSNWYAGNYKNGTGKYTVLESFLEMNLPILNSETLGRANINGAGRATRYSTSGVVYAWKVGGTWETPLDGFRLRAVTSRDVRAPNLSELFAAPVTTTVPNFTDPRQTAQNPNGRQVLIIQNTIGNTALRPEIARNTELGVVYARPSWLPGLSVSFDYYKINLKDVVSSLSAQQIVNLCVVEKIPDTCGAFDLDSDSKFVNVQSFNLASIKTDGFDIEASYQWRKPLGIEGNFTVRALATHVMKFVTDPGLPGTIPVDTAGANSGATPDWKWLATESYDNDQFSITLQQRWFSDGVIGNQYVVCQPGNCPVSTANNPTIDFNRIKGAFYFDVGGALNVTKQVSMFFKVDNLFDHDPEPSPQTNTGLDVNPALYDTLGRFFRIGARARF